MKKEEVILKIRKLLALTESPNEHEANAAMCKVQDLLTKYHLSMLDLNKSDKGENGGGGPKYWETAIQLPKGYTILQRYVVTILVNHFYVEVLTPALTKDSCAITIVGEDHNIEIAYYVYHSLIKQFIYLWNDSLENKETTLSDYQGVLLGMYTGLNKKLESEKQVTLAESKALTVASDDLHSFVLKKAQNKAGHPFSPDKTLIDGTAFALGKKLGASMSVAAGIKSAADQRKKIA
jgi:hypothetical protein